MSWITLKTTATRWEAEFLQQVLVAHQIPVRLVDLGLAPYFGYASTTALQVRAEDQWTALLLISPLEEQPGSEESAL